MDLLTQLWSHVTAFLESERMGDFALAAVELVVGLIVARIVAAGLVRLTSKRADAHQSVLIRRITFYVVAGAAVGMAYDQAGFNVSILLGAAGVLTVAIGFASQTSASNVISGLFLLGERPFAIGDVIRIGETTGEVLSIDLLSAKLRTFDNLFVRVPNETLIKSQITNLTRFPIRRLDIHISVAFKEDMDRVRNVLMEVADANPLCLDEPRPLFIFQGFGESALNFQYSVWTFRENFLEVRNTIQSEIKKAFDLHGIEIPYPHRTLHAGAAMEPIAIRLVEGPPSDEAAS